MGSSFRSRCTLCASQAAFGSQSEIPTNLHLVKAPPRLVRLARPGANPSNFCQTNTRDEARWRIFHRGELHSRAHIYLGQPSQQFRGTAFFNVRLSIEHSVLNQPHRILPAGLQRDGHPRVASDILDLRMFVKVSSHQIIAVEPKPDQRDLRATIAIEGDEMSQGSCFDQRADFLRNFHVKHLFGVVSSKLSPIEQSRCYSVRRGSSLEPPVVSI